MLFAIGTRVRFIHSNDEGVVTALLGDGMVNVLLDDNFEIPAFLDDLVRADEDFPTVKAKIVPGKQEKPAPAPAPTAPERPAAETQYTIIKGAGIQVAFDPVIKSDANAEKYLIYLINDTNFDVLFSYGLSLNNHLKYQHNGKLNGMSTYLVGELQFDDLNDSPEVDLQCWRILTDGTGSRLHKNLKIKPKQFFKRLVTAPLLNKPVHLFRAIENLKDAVTRQMEEEDLRAYTKRKAKPVFNDDPGSLVDPHEVKELAEFVPELDLHIEQLVENPQKLSNAEILHIQLRHFDAYIDKALRLGIKRVFVIHGIGKGRLRDAIATRLLRLPEVDTFKNEFHPRYGYGATEVIFLG
ncbi:MAG: DUF2027 domain-containing protein [Saprospiraceae bacterium]|jgi:hypothetical protein|nr:DUF2027 domain-containing protein [Saprospiraceae bacterium]